MLQQGFFYSPTHNLIEDLRDSLEVFIDNNKKKDYFNSFNEDKYNNSMNIMHKYEFDRKILEQIDICKNRVLFLKKELLRSKNKLGQIISQKKLIEEKIKFSFFEELRVKEEKLLRTTPAFRKI